MYPKLGIARKSDKTPSLRNGVQQTPGCCSEHAQGSCRAQLLCLTPPWHKALLHSNARTPQNTPQVFLSLGLLLSTLQECQWPCEPGTGQAGSWFIPSLILHVLPWGCGLGSGSLNQHQGDTPGAVCKQITTEQDKHYHVSLTQELLRINIILTDQPRGFFLIIQWMKNKKGSNNSFFPPWKCNGQMLGSIFLGFYSILQKNRKNFAKLMAPAPS